MNNGNNCELQVEKLHIAAIANLLAKNGEMKIEQVFSELGDTFSSAKEFSTFLYRRSHIFEISTSPISTIK